MNGQQLTNSSNSANGTPSSSYPASLSSQSSRDVSPASRSVPRKPLPESYNHITTNHWAPDQPVTNSSHAKTEVQESQPAITQQPRHPPPSSQPVYRFQSPSPQSNHLPQPNNVTNQLPPQPHETPRSTQSPLQTQSNNQFQKPLIQQQPNQLQKTVTDQPHQFSSNPYHTLHPQNPIQQQQKFSQPSSQVLNQIPPTKNQLIQPPGQFNPQTQPQPHNKFVHPQNQTPQPLNQFPQQNQVPQPQNQIPQSQNQFTQSQNKIPQSQNQFPQSQNQIPQSQNQFPQSQNQIPQSQNQFPQSQNQITQPQNQFPQPPSQPQLQNQFPQSQNQIPQSQNQFPKPQLQNQFSQPQNQILQIQNRFSHPSKQMPPGPNLTQTPNQFSQPSNHYPPLPPQPQMHNRLPMQPPPPSQFNKRYPQMPPSVNAADGLVPHMANMSFQQQPGYQQPIDGTTPQMPGRSVNQGFNKMWGMDTVDLLQCRELVPPERMEPPPVRLQHELYEALNCSPEIFRCTLTKIPETKSLLDKSRLPLGVLIHPFKDLNQLSVIQCTVIVRCRMCRTYINPFVYFVDNKRWKCNLCFRVNELPDEFQFDPMTKTYGDPSRRPEIKSATIEFIAPSEYMVRPPQPAVYVFVLDVSRLACECGYLDAVCRTLLAELDNVPGDARTSVAFITFDSAVHFYSLSEGQAQPHQMIVVDIDDMFLPTPDNLLVSLNECRELIRDLLQELPTKFQESYDTHSALGAALQAAYKLLSPTGGRVTVFQACLPNVGPGALTPREDPAQRAGDNPPHLNPSTDFYKKLALDCSGQQIAVDLFLVNCQYVDLATLSGVSRFSGGCMHHIPLYRSDKPLLVDTLERTFQRYLIRKIGFESVMRLRCTRGLSIHTFHGNFFVRSTDLLSLPNANPDAGFGMQVTIDENLTEIQNVCFQAALLYTSSKGERRIRVHTLCLPVASNLADVMHGADQQCIVGLLAKMAVDRAVQSSLSDAREAFINVVADVLSAYRLTQSSPPVGCLLAPSSLRLLPLYILALLKHVAFRVGQSTRLDDRVFAMCQMKSLPLTLLMQSVYPDLYSLLNIEQMPEVEIGDQKVVQPPRLQLSSERVDSHGLYLMDDGSSLLMYVGHNLSPGLCQAVFQVPHFAAIPQELYSLPELDNPSSSALRNFISYLQSEKPSSPTLQVIRDDSPHRMRFIERLVEDKNESGTSYYEFLQRIKSLVK